MRIRCQPAASSLRAAENAWARRHHHGALQRLRAGNDAPRAGQVRQAHPRCRNQGRRLMSWRASDFASREDFTADFRSDIYEEVRSGRGFVLLRGLSTAGISLEQFVTEVSAIARRFGRALSQSAEGELVGHVIDASRAEPTPRLFRSNLELRPHTD